MRLTVKSAQKNSITLKWNKVKGADGYVVYGRLCKHKGKKNAYKELATITGNGKTEYKHNKLKKNKFYEYYVCAYKVVDGEKVVVASSVDMHATTTSQKYANAAKVSIKIKTSKKADFEALKTKGKTLLAGKKLYIRGVEASKDGKKLVQHQGVRYESSDSSIAAVDKNGKITAKKAGKCYIYAYAQDGVYSRMYIKVKKK